MGSNTYNNFDTDSIMYEYTVDAVENVPEIVSAQAGRLNGGDFEWVFTEEDDASSLPEVSSVLPEEELSPFPPTDTSFDV